MEKYEIDFEELKTTQKLHSQPIYREYDNGMLVIGNIIFCKDSTCSENEYIKVNGIGILTDRYRDCYDYRR